MARLMYCTRGHPFTEENTVTYGGQRKCRACRACSLQKSEQLYKKAKAANIGKTRPTKVQLATLLIVDRVSFRAIGIMYGVSDNAVRKWAKAYGIPHLQKDLGSAAKILYIDVLVERTKQQICMAEAALGKVAAAILQCSKPTKVPHAWNRREQPKV